MRYNKKYDAILVIGTNSGNRKQNISTALFHIKNNNSIEIIKYSSLYLTAPWGYLNQNNFFNIALSIRTDYSPIKLLDFIKQLEKNMGRLKSQKWRQRIIDIDIALFGKVILKTKKLTIPHKYLLKRDFFLRPILELDKNLIFPETDKKLEYFLKKNKIKTIIRKIKFNFNN